MSERRLTIGLDLDQTIYGFPTFFRQFIAAMHAAGHPLLVTSNHLRSQWPQDCQRLAALGIDSGFLDPGLLQRGPHQFGLDHKRYMSRHVDVMFDDCAAIQPLTTTPIFICPAEKADDRR